MSGVVKVSGPLWSRIVAGRGRWERKSEIALVLPPLRYSRVKLKVVRNSSQRLNRVRTSSPALRSSQELRGRGSLVDQR